jgi:hypothetical protein
MKLMRRDFLTFLIGGGIGGAAATAMGLTYYYKVVKWYPRFSDHGAPSDWILTEKDLEAFAEADKAVSSDQLVILDNSDILGDSGYQAMRVHNLGECVTSCEQDSKCKAFTYARSTHEHPAKRQMCWLNADKPEKIVNDLATYVSGHRY